MPGRLRIAATSSRPICEAPSSPMPRPACVPTSFTLARLRETATRMVSRRPMRKQAKLVQTGIFPIRAMPAAAPIMFCSAMPNSKCRSGCFLANSAVMVDLERSESRTTSSGNLPASSTNDSPNASRVALPMMEDLLESVLGLRRCCPA